MLRWNKHIYAFYGLLFVSFPSLFTLTANKNNFFILAIPEIQSSYAERDVVYLLGSNECGCGDTMDAGISPLLFTSTSFLFLTIFANKDVQQS
jgi:hypothetical protein